MGCLKYILEMAATKSPNLTPVATVASVSHLTLEGSGSQSADSGDPSVRVGDSKFSKKPTDEEGDDDDLYST